jgi:N-acetylhexosamine 1-kinase
VLQQVNIGVLGDPTRLMANALSTSACVAAMGGAPLDYRTASDGEPFHLDENGGAWRCYEYVVGTITARPDSTDAARAIGYGFGAFDSALAMREPGDWHTVIEGYHDHERRFADLAAAVDADVAGRVDSAVADITAATELIEVARATEEYAAWHEAPRRIAHHDAKGVNLVARPDGRTTVLDLDTVMGGTILSDVGELIRTCTRPRSLDEPFDPDLAEAAVWGFIEGWGLGVTEAESRAVPLAGVLMSLQNAVRFLTDHLAGDVYYRVDHPDENLRRAQVMTAHAARQLAGVDEFRRRILG